MPETSPALVPLESLLDETEANDAQLWLTLGEVGFSAGRVDRSGPAKRYTGAVLFREKPELYKAIVVLGAEPGMSIRRICKITHCTDDTVKAVLAREPLAVAAHKKNLLGEGRLVQRASLERLNELSPTMNAKDAALTFGIVTDKIELLSGGVTARVEVHDGAAVLARFMELHGNIEKMVRGEVIETAPVTGSTEEKPAANGAGACETFAAITSDNKSNVKSGIVDPETVTTDTINSIPITELADADPLTVRAIPAPPGGGGIAARQPADQPHPLIQPEIL